MIKEFIFAIVLGTLIGFGSSKFLFFAKQKPSISTTPTPAITTTQTTPEPSGPVGKIIENPTSIKIESHQNESVVSQANITLKGSTTPTSLVIVTTTTDSYQTLSDNQGYFSIDLSLNPGGNDLKIKSVSSEDIQLDTELFITYTTAKIQ